MEQIIAENMGKVIVGQGGIGGLVLVWCYLKIKQQCERIISLERNGVDKQICDIKHLELKEDFSEMKTDNKEAHTAIFKKIDDLKDLIIEGAKQ